MAAAWKASRAVGSSGGEVHLRWDLRKSAKAFPPICTALVIEFWTPVGRVNETREMKSIAGVNWSSDASCTNLCP